VKLFTYNLWEGKLKKLSKLILVQANTKNIKCKVKNKFQKIKNQMKRKKKKKLKKLIRIQLKDLEYHKQE